MIHLDELIRVPPGVGGIRPGVHRVVYLAPRERLAALFWIGLGEPGKALKLVGHSQKPKACDLLHIEQLLHKNLVQRITEVPPEKPHNRVRWSQAATAKFARNKSILQQLTAPDAQFSILFSGC